MRISRQVSAGSWLLFLLIGLTGFFGIPVPVAHAATAPALGDASTFSVLGALSTSAAGAGTTVSGDLGLSPGLAVSRTGPWTVGGSEYFGVGGLSQDAQTDALAAFTNLATQSSDGVWASTSPVPGVYTIAADTTFAGPTLTLNGDYDDVWVFQIGNDMTFNGSVVLAGNAQACNVFWQVGRDATIAAGSSFVGTLIASRDIALISGATVNGRVISLNSSITTDGNVISGPTCTPAPSGGGSSTYTGTITVVKTVVNDNGGSETISDFPLFINGTAVTSGSTNAFSFANNAVPYTVSETTDADYEAVFSGDCDEDGLVYLEPAENAFCFITNDDIGAPVVVPPVPPIINIVKVPNPLALPDGPGSVEYTYTVTNPGTVAMSDVTTVGDTCEPIVRVSGDADGDNMLDVTEAWTYTCTTTLTETHTNTVVATGWANGLSAVDTASATVIVGVPVIPPLIHVTKVPNPLTLLAGGGNVTYTETVTNPGTIPLNNVTLTDDTCSPMTRVSGDADGDNQLDPTESWQYTCTTNVTETTTNTAVASGTANGFVVRDFALATVVVADAVPALPVTGVAPTTNGQDWKAVAAALVAAAGLLYVIRKQRSA